MTRREFREAPALITAFVAEGPEGSYSILESSSVPRDRLILALSGNCVALAREGGKLMVKSADAVLEAMGDALITLESESHPEP